MKKIMFNDKYCLTDAVLDGTKTMTRRVCTLTLTDANTMDEVEIEDIYLKDGVWMFKFRNKEFHLPKENYPKYQVGDIVAISQSYSECTCDIPEKYISKYKDGKMVGYSAGWSNKMFVKAEYMPNTLRIINVKAERLQDISNEDCIKEGIEYVGDSMANGLNDYFYHYHNENLKPERRHQRVGMFCSAREALHYLIDDISGRGTWSRNKWNWVYEFELIK